MRVVSGTLKGRALKAVPGSSTRPTTDKVKEAIFNMVGPYFEGGIALDLYAGSGGLGIEALSRGMEKAIFVDRDIKAFQTVQENIRECELEKVTEIYRNDATRALKAIIKREIAFKGIFLDPPYKKQQLATVLEIIHQFNLLEEDGFIVCEHGLDVILPIKVGTLMQVKKEQYGIIGVTIFKNGVNQ